MTPRELAEQLIGTTGIGVPQPNEVFGDNIQQLAEFDELAFCCDGCSWWCSTNELHNEHDRDLCDECNEEEFGDGEY